MAKLKRIVCFGDSITACSNFSEKYKWPVILQRHLDDSHPGKFEVFNRGVGGSTTFDGMTRLNNILSLKPSYVIVEFGFNDSVMLINTDKPKVSIEEFTRNLEQFYRSFKKIKAETVFILNHPTKHRLLKGVVNPRSSYEDIMKKFNSAIRKTAAKFKAPLIDMPKEMKRRKISMKDFLDPNDGIHLSPAGCENYGNIVYDNILKVI
ncbi:MAG: SGNH/GDSL hydrolase family protein [Planctomycetota bacterium]|jgi:lysophospholipase L1-like esterase